MQRGAALLDELSAAGLQGGVLGGGSDITLWRRRSISGAHHRSMDRRTMQSLWLSAAHIMPARWLQDHEWRTSDGRWSARCRRAWTLA